jgi:pyruvate ferredoxin oxidoreductase beta subunit
MAQLAQITKLAVDTCVWPLYEVEEGIWRLSYIPKKKLPVEEFMRPQGRFRHMFQKGNEWMIEEVQKQVDQRWESLLEKTGA